VWIVFFFFFKLNSPNEPFCLDRERDLSRRPILFIPVFFFFRTANKLLRVTYYSDDRQFLRWQNMQRRCIITATSNVHRLAPDCKILKKKKKYLIYHFLVTQQSSHKVFTRCLYIFRNVFQPPLLSVATCVQSLIIIIVYSVLIAIGADLNNNVSGSVSFYLSTHTLRFIITSQCDRSDKSQDKTEQQLFFTFIRVHSVRLWFITEFIKKVIDIDWLRLLPWFRPIKNNTNHFLIVILPWTFNASIFWFYFYTLL
jgi:hypothetical protein